MQALTSLGVQLYANKTEFRVSKEYINEMAKVVKNSTSRFSYASSKLEQILSMWKSSH